MATNILVFPIWRVSGRFQVPINNQDNQEVVEMKNAVNFAVAVGQTAHAVLPVSHPQPQEQKPAGELVDARERFAQKEQLAECVKAKRSIRKFFRNQIDSVEARHYSLSGLWIG